MGVWGDGRERAELESRIEVLEGALAELARQLNEAVCTPLTGMSDEELKALVARWPSGAWMRGASRCFAELERRRHVEKVGREDVA